MLVSDSGCAHKDLIKSLTDNDLGSPADLVDEEETLEEEEEEDDDDEDR